MFICSRENDQLKQQFDELNKITCKLVDSFTISKNQEKIKNEVKRKATNF